VHRILSLIGVPVVSCVLVCASAADAQTVALANPGDAIEASAASANQAIIPLAGDGGAAGQAMIIDNANGPDELIISVSGLPPSTRLTVFLTHSPITGALPAQFVGEFRTNPVGTGVFKARTEVTNAFASANQSLADASGIAEVLAAGALIAGANTIPLDWIRIYLGDATTLATVFGPGEGTPGGLLAVTATAPIP